MDQIQAAIQWLAVLRQLLSKGQEVWDEVRRLLADHGIEWDNAALDAAILEAEQAKLDAIRESVVHGGQS